MLNDWRNRSRQRMMTEMPKDFSMPVAPRRHQHAMPHLPAIVANRVPRERGEPSIRFLHDQIGRGNIPVVAVAADKSGIELALGDPAQPQRQGTDSRMQGNIAERFPQSLDQRFWTRDARKIQLGARRGSE